MLLLIALRTSILIYRSNNKCEISIYAYVIGVLLLVDTET
jgi:hypothetical protein